MERPYDRSTEYCPTRRTLEQRSFDLVGRLATLTDHLLRITGRDRIAFAAIKTECASVRSEVLAARQELDAHRLAHGC